MFREGSICLGLEDVWLLYTYTKIVVVAQVYNIRIRFASVLVSGEDFQKLPEGQVIAD